MTTPALVNNPNNDEAARDRAEQRRLAGPWLHAWHDPVASVNAFSSCVRLSDLNADGDHKLLIADADKKLKVYKGTSLISEHALLDVPVALATFYSDLNKPNTPSVAVAAGSYIFIYRNLRPYYKFTLPPVDINPIETEIWTNLRADKIDALTCISQLTEASNNGIMLSSRSQNLLAIGQGLANSNNSSANGPNGSNGSTTGGNNGANTNQQSQSQGQSQGPVLSSSPSPNGVNNNNNGNSIGPELREQQMFIDAHKHLPLVQLSVVTCMEILNKNMSGDRSVSSLVVGTESCHLIIMEPSGTNVLKKFELPSVPVFIAVSGTYDVEYRIVIACRNGNVYSIKKGKLMGTVIELETQPVGLVIMDKNILVGCMDNVIHAFHFKGAKAYSLYLPEPISCMSLLHLKRIQSIKLLLVALSSGEIRLYNGKHMISSFATKDTITGMRFGQYGREEGALILTSKSGGLTIKMLQRTAKLDIASSPAGPPAEQDIPLNVPKKTKLYVEQTQRERDQAIDMHRIFQRDLCKLRLNTARAFVNVISTGQGPLSMTGGASLRLDARVTGLGREFRVTISIKNTGQKVVMQVPVMCTFNKDMYTVKHPLYTIPCLVPGIEYSSDFEVCSIHPMGLADPIRIFVCNPKSVVPAISAIVNMPVSQVNDEIAPAPPSILSVEDSSTSVKHDLDGTSEAAIVP